MQHIVTRSKLSSTTSIDSALEFINQFSNDDIDCLCETNEFDFEQGVLHCLDTHRNSTLLSIPASFFVLTRATRCMSPSSIPEQRLFLRLTSHIFSLPWSPLFSHAQHIISGLARLIRSQFQVSLRSTIAWLAHAVNLYDINEGSKHDSHNFEDIHTHTSVLTPSHISLAVLAVEHSVFSHCVLKVLCRLPLDIVPSLTSTNILEYMFFSGVFLMSLKQWQSARSRFACVLVIPTNHPNTYQVRAVQKLLLVTLIASPHKLRSQITHRFDINLLLPQNASNSIAQIINEPFESLQIYFSILSAANLGKDSMNAVIFQHQKKLEEASDWSLAKEAVQAVTRLRISDLSRIFCVLSLQDIARECCFSDGIDKLEKILFQMIRDNQIFARIDESTKFLTFLEKPFVDQNDELISQIRIQMKIGMQCYKQAKTVNTNLAIDLDEVG